MLEFLPSTQTRKTIADYKRRSSFLQLLIPITTVTVFLSTIRLAWPPTLSVIIFVALLSLLAGLVMWLIEIGFRKRLERLEQLHLKVTDKALDCSSGDRLRTVYFSEIEKIVFMRTKADEISSLYVTLPRQSVNLSKLERKDELFNLLRERAPNAVFEQKKFFRWQREAIIWGGIVLFSRLIVRVLDMFPESVDLLNVIFFGMVAPCGLWKIFHKGLPQKGYKRLLYSTLWFVVAIAYIFPLSFKPF